jgi:hypothetical protein
MDSPQGQQIELKFDETSFPKTVFANHVEVVGVEGYTTVTFYSVVFPRAAHMRSDPPVLTARPVAQVTLPGGKWQELMESIRRVDEQAREAAKGDTGNGTS